MGLKPFNELNEREKTERLSALTLIEMLNSLEELDGHVSKECEDDDFNEQYSILYEKYIKVCCEFKELIYNRFNPQ